MENKTYHEQKTIEYTKKLRVILADMPGYVTTYFRGIEPRTLPRTRLGYAEDLKVFFEWLHESNPQLKSQRESIKQITCDDLSTLQSFDIEEYMEFLKVRTDKDGEEIINSESGIKRKMAALRGLYAYLYKNQMIDNNPTVMVDLPKIHEKAIVRMDVDEIAKFLDTVESGAQNMTDRQRKFHEQNKIRDLAMMTLMLGTGIRVTECVGLDINDVDVANSRIKVTRKGGYEAFVYFGHEVEDALLPYLEARKETKGIVPGHENALFLSSRKRRICVRNVEIMVKNYAKHVTTLKKITPHKLRSSYGTALYQETGDIYLVADVLGHKDVNTTKKHYAAIEEERRRKAKDIVKLRDETDYEEGDNDRKDHKDSNDSDSDAPNE
ncbi:MAG: tyrosine-type recombinase/integrase [Lachnospiraceae bacterium]|nr:tyrosine-type recombinase/integrase [Lachnospiraceae bacterium]